MTEKNEKQTCPRRIGEIGPWQREDLVDLWLPDRWTTDLGLAQAEIDKWRSENPNGSCSDSAGMWHWSWGPPKTCSFCGSIHPDDALRLIREGWEHERSKQYKFYLNPPGENQRREQVLKTIGSDRDFSAVPSVWTPIPPVKAYIQHFDELQVDALNQLLFGESEGQA